MSATMDVGTFLILEGALVLGLVVVRVLCLPRADFTLMPTVVRHRVDRITRASPIIATLAGALIVAGLILR